MGHLLSKNGYRLKKRTRKLHHRKKKKRNCFLQLPCMLCFIVHSNSTGLDDDSDHLGGWGQRQRVPPQQHHRNKCPWCRVELASEQLLPQSSLSDTQHLHLLRTAPSSCCHHGSWLSGRAKGGAFYQLFLQN
ncbi:hypothetical protein E3U43_000784 [Larimichthys crocea]|uniref:Uncharacterized protein n=1 Tax=Larimichthys crocea TaxID=215358 RepID=A0ACD3Q9N3_LARCR|nr:hypothetical protein E3U43_000784 [Larimichthys crocea]